MRRGGLFAILLAAVMMAGCGSSMYSESTSTDTAMAGGASRAAAGVSNQDVTAEDSVASYNYASAGEAVADVYDESSLEEMDPSYGVDEDDIEEVDTRKKVIRDMSFNVETTDLDTLDQTIQDKVNELGGYIEDSSVDGSTVYDDGYYLGDDGMTYYDTSYAARSGNMRQYRYAYYTIRIPAGSLDQFAQAVEEGANVLSQSTSTQDITSSYVDTDSRRKSLEEELQILNDMARKAESVEDLIQIEAQRSDVRYQLENIKSQLKSMDDRVAYSTVNLNVTEVTVLTDTTARNLTWQERIGNGFANSCERLVTTSQEIVIWIASNAPMIAFYIVLAVIALVALRIVLAAIIAILGIKRSKKARKGCRNGKTVMVAADKADANGDKMPTDIETTASSKAAVEDAKADTAPSAAEDAKADTTSPAAENTKAE